MKTITKKNLSTSSKDELLSFIAAIDRLDVNERMLILAELENRNENELIEEINQQLNKQGLKISTSISGKAKGDILEYYQQLFDQKIEKEKIYTRIANRFGYEQFEIQRIIGLEIKNGKRIFLMGIVLIILGAFSLFAALYLDNQSSGLAFIRAFALLIAGIFAVFNGHYKSRLAKGK